MKPVKFVAFHARKFTRSTYFLEAITLDDSGTILVLPAVLFFGILAAAISLVEIWTPAWFSVGIEVSAFEVGGGILGLLLVLRTNEGISRWWEARRLWGGITNQSRNLVIAALSYGPADPAWRSSIVRWTAVFGHVCRRSLRAERAFPEVAALVGEEEAERLASAPHMPTHTAIKLAGLIQDGIALGMDRLVAMQVERERSGLVDHLGGCERILSTPLPKAYSIQIRRFIFLFLMLVPFGLIPKFIARDPNSLRVWFTPFITMLLAFPLLALDRIGAELQNPFAMRNLNHLDLDGITTRIESNLIGLSRASGPIEVSTLAPDHTPAA